MNLARLHLRSHEGIRLTQKDLIKSFDDDIYYTQDRNYTHPLYGRVQLFREVNTNRMIMALADTIDSEEETLKAIAECQVRMRLNQPNLLFMLDYSIKKVQGFCSASYTLNRYFEFPMTNLTRDIRERQTKDDFFSYKELSLLCAQTLNVLSSLHANQVYHGNISTNTIQHKRVNSFFVLLDSLEGNEDLIAFHQHNPSDTTETYPSPELHQEVYEGRNRNIDEYKNDVFSLGMVVLAAGVLRPVRDCYEPGGMFNPDPLQAALNKFYLRYGGKQSPLCNAVTSMLDMNMKRRPDAKSVRAQFLNASLGESNIENAIQNMTDISEISPIDGDNQPTLPNAKILDPKVLNDTVEEPHNDTVLRGASGAVAIKKVMAARVLQPVDFKSPIKGESNVDTVEKIPASQLPVQAKMERPMTPDQIVTRNSSTDKILTLMSPDARLKNEQIEQRHASVSKALDLKYDNFFDNAVPNVYKAKQPVTVQQQEPVQIRRQSDIQPFTPKLAETHVVPPMNEKKEFQRPPSILLPSQNAPNIQRQQQSSAQIYYFPQASNSDRDIFVPKTQTVHQPAESMRMIRIDNVQQETKPILTRNNNSFVINNQQTAFEQPRFVVRSRSMVTESPKVIEPQSLREVTQKAPNMPNFVENNNSVQLQVPVSQRQLIVPQNQPVLTQNVHSSSANINPRQNLLKIYNPAPNDIRVYSVQSPILTLSKPAAEAYDNRVPQSQRPALSVTPVKETSQIQKQERIEATQSPKYFALPNYNLKTVQRSVPDIDAGRQKNRSEFINPINVYESPVQVFKRKQGVNQQTTEKAPNMNKTQHVVPTALPTFQPQRATYIAPRPIGSQTEKVNIQQITEGKVPASSWQNVDMQGYKQQSKFIKTESQNRFIGDIQKQQSSQAQFSHKQVFRVLQKHTQQTSKAENEVTNVANYSSNPNTTANNRHVTPDITLAVPQTEQKQLPKLPKVSQTQLTKPSLQSFIQDRGHRQFYVSSNALSSRKQSSFQ